MKTSLQCVKLIIAAPLLSVLQPAACCWSALSPCTHLTVFTVLAGHLMRSSRRLQTSGLTFFDYSPWTEESTVQSQVRVELMFLEALVQSRVDGGQGRVAEPECSCGKNIGGWRVHIWIISSIGSNVMIKRVWPNNLWNIVSHGDDLGGKDHTEGNRIL